MASVRVNLGVAVGLVALLSGCTGPFGPGLPAHSVAMKLSSSGSLVFQFCESIRVDSIEVYSLPSNELTLLWSTTGPAQLPPEVTYGSPPPGWDTETGPAPLDPTEIFVMMAVNRDGSLVASNTVDGSTLEEDRWLDSSGDYFASADAACGNPE